MDSTRVVIIDDDPNECQAVAEMLKNSGASVTKAHNGNEGLALLRSQSFDVLFADLNMPDCDGLTLIKEARRVHPHLPAVVITGHGSFESSVDALRLGVVDYLTKPLQADQLTDALIRAKQAARRRGTVSRPETSMRTESTGNELIANSTSMREVVEQAKRVAVAEIPLYLWGEPGVGKGTVARVIHSLSARMGCPFLAIDCAAVQQDQLEPLMFGVDASIAGGNMEPGLLEQASGGFVYLHNITELPKWIQSKLYHSIQNRSCIRLGGHKPIGFDVRIVASGSQELTVASSRGLITNELYYYLNVVSIFVPPLRHRRADIKLLIDGFLREFKRTATDAGKGSVPMSREALDALLEHKWPGNIHELSNLIRRAALFAGGGEITLEQVRQLLPNSAGNETTLDTITVPLAGDLKVIERSIVNEVVNRCHGNKAAAARTLGLHRRTLYRIIQNRRGDENGSSN